MYLKTSYDVNNNIRHILTENRIYIETYILPNQDPNSILINIKFIISLNLLNLI